MTTLKNKMWNVRLKLTNNTVSQSKTAQMEQNQNLEMLMHSISSPSVEEFF